MTQNECDFVGRFKIITKTNETYDVYDTDTQSLVVADLYLWSAAYAISKALHERRFSDVNTVTYLEAKYAKHVFDMKVYQHTKQHDRFLNEQIEIESIIKKIHSFCEK